MNLYYSIDDLSLDDGPIIVNMIVERADGKQFAASQASDAVVEEFDIQGLVDAAEYDNMKRRMHAERIDRYQAEVENVSEREKALVTDLESLKGENLRLTYELEECRRDRDEHYLNWKNVRSELDGFWRVEVERRLETIVKLQKEVCQLTEERDELKARLEASEKALKGES